MSYPMTGIQRGYIARLLAERTDLDVEKFVQTIEAQRLTKEGANTLINKLLAMPVKTPAAEAAEARPARTNAYAAKCNKCRAQVPAHEGSLSKVGGSWIVEHFPRCPEVEATPEAPADKRGLINDLLDGVSDGVYAVPCWTGANDLTFVKIGTNKGFYRPELKGHRYVRNFVGGVGDTPVGIEWIKTAIEAIKVAPVEAMGLAGRELNQCGRCGHDLTDQESRARGIGPECFGKVSS